VQAHVFVLGVNIRFTVKPFTTASEGTFLKSAVVSDVILCIVYHHHRFGATCCLHLQGSDRDNGTPSLWASVPKMGTPGVSETLLMIYHSTRSHFPEDTALRTPCFGKVSCNFDKIQRSSTGQSGLLTSVKSYYKRNVLNSRVLFNQDVAKCFHRCCQEYHSLPLGV
jgi:hypothetical protein